MIDREARDQLAGIIESYLDEKITAFQFDDQILQLRDETEDETVQHVIHTLWLYYDDCTDHTVVLSKEQWDYFQRLLLLLRSDAEVSIEPCRRWGWRQALAGATLLCFIGIAIALGFGAHLFIVTIPFGAVSIMISRTHPRPSENEMRQIMLLAPFDSTAQMLTVRRRVTGFQKRRYPLRLAGKRIRSTSSERFHHVHTIVMWLICSPLVLLFQALPNREEQVTLVPS